MSVAITVRDVPDDVRNELASRAAKSGQSMQQYIRQVLIEVAERPLQSEVLSRIVARNLAMGGGPSRQRIVEMIREDRESH